MTKQKMILPRDQVIALQLEGRSWDEIGCELGITSAAAENTYRIAELILAEGIVGIFATPMLREPHEADCLPLRDVINDLAEQHPASVLYPTLLRMLDCAVLTFDWFEQDGRPIRLWSTNAGVGLMSLLPEPTRPASRSGKILSEVEKLEQFVMGNLVFTIDIFDDVQFGGRVNVVE